MTKKKNSQTNLRKEFQVADAINLIYTYLTVADAYIEKYSINNKELYHLGLIMDNIKAVILKLDKNYNVLTDVIIENDKKEKETIIANFEKILK